MLSSIFEATKARCIKEQRLAALAHKRQAEYSKRGFLASAEQTQREAAGFAQEAMWRLDRLIGAA